MIQENVALVKRYIDLIYNQQYDPKNLPIKENSGVIMGKSMTEKQGGSDVRANTTIAHPVDTVPKGNISSAYHLAGLIVVYLRTNNVRWFSNNSQDRAWCHMMTYTVWRVGL